jgi:hypothetical protein
LLNHTVLLFSHDRDKPRYCYRGESMPLDQRPRDAAISAACRSARSAAVSTVEGID